jgi:hypothetical protein
MERIPRARWKVPTKTATMAIKLTVVRDGTIRSGIFMASEPARFKPKVVVTPASVFKPNRRKISRPTPIRTDP